MKCPFMKVTKHQNGSVVESFNECYGSECPYYSEELIGRSLEVNNAKDSETKIKTRCKRALYG